MALLYSDENFPIPVVGELRRLGHDVASSQERGRAGKRVPDPDVLAFAVSEGRAVLTINRRHFMRLHMAESNHAGIVVCTEDPDFAGQAARVHAAVVAAGDLRGQLLRVNRPNPPPPAGS